MPVSKSLAERIVESCTQSPQRTLLRDGIGSQTGEQLLGRIRAIEAVVRQIAPDGGRIGVLFFNSVSRAVAVLATIVAGRVPVILDAGESLPRCPIQSGLLKLNGLLTSATDFSDIPRFTSTVFLDSTAQIVRSEIEAAPVVNQPPAAGTALILHTSGSTGNRKGVQVPERGILYTVDHLIPYFQLGPASKALVVLPISHSMGLNTQFLPTFLAGGECHFVEANLSLNRCYRTLLASEATFVSLIGELLRICAEERRKRNLPPATHVKHAQLAGGTIRAEHLRMAAELFPNAVLHKGYGLTEAIRVSMIASDDPAFLRDSAGYVLPGQEVCVRTPAGEPAAEGVAGQICVRGPNVMLGYDRSEEPSPIRDGWLTTGDLGHFEGGRLVIQGRGDSIFKVAGDWVSAVEIERVVSETASGVRDVKVVPVPDSKLGNRVVLFLEVGEEEKTAFLSSGKTYFEASLRSRLPRVSLPREVIILDKFPRLGNGKLKNQALAHFLQTHGETESGGQTGFRYRIMSGELLN
jgi:acyl-CoA synthetase (AMP-forming)/AMP-acid ligase II